MTRLSQMLAIEKGLRDSVPAAVRDSKRKLAAPALLSGLSRSYRPRDEDGDQFPSEATRVQLRAEDVLRDVARSMTRLFDVVYTKEQANTHARADVVVDGETLLPAVPAPYLLFLEKQVAEIAELVMGLPVLDPSEEWTFDPNRNVYATPPVNTVRSKKVPRAHVLYEATEHHPAQVQPYTEDIPAGDWTTVKFSGALPAARVRAVAERVVKLHEAVKAAREEANTTEVADRKAGEAVFAYLFAA